MVKDRCLRSYSPLCASTLSKAIMDWMTTHLVCLYHSFFDVASILPVTPLVLPRVGVLACTQFGIDTGG